MAPKTLTSERLFAEYLNAKSQGAPEAAFAYGQKLLHRMLDTGEEPDWMPEDSARFHSWMATFIRTGKGEA